MLRAIRLCLPVLCLAALCPAADLFAAVQSVVWTNTVNVSVNGNSLKKTGGCEGCEDGKGVSQQSLTAGDGYVEFTATEPDKLRFVGFNSGATGSGFTGMDFAIRLGTGYAEVREKGSYRADTPLAAGDVLRIAVEGGQVKYYKNGTLMYTSTVAPAYPLKIDASLLDLNSTVTNAVFSAGGAAGRAGLRPAAATGGAAGGPPAAGASLPGFPGGFIELNTSTAARPLLSAAQVQAFLPDRGPFTFPAPYHTIGIRLTNESDCGGGDCVESVGYAYWRNINHHAGGSLMYIFLGMNRGKGGQGPTLFSYDKTTNEVKNLGPLFASGTALGASTGEQWYFSATLPTKLYVFEAGSGSKLMRYDVLTKQRETVFDTAGQYGTDKYIWQPHSSNDDKVHMVTLRSRSNYQMLGCVVYREDTKQFSYFARKGDLDECNLDKAGRWLVMLDNVDGKNGLDNRIIDLQSGAETILYDEQGGAGHLDTGYGMMVGEDNWNAFPGAARIYTFGQTPIAGPVVYHTTDWSNDLGHVSFENASATVPLAEQYACNSHASRTNAPRANEIVCYGMNTSGKVLVVAPVMTDLNAAGGGPDDYAKAPKGNLDGTGQYFIWTSNVGGARQDAFLVKVPGSLLTGAPAPTLSGRATLSAQATARAGVDRTPF